MGTDNLGQAARIPDLNESQQFEPEDQELILALQLLDADDQDLASLGEMLNRREGEVDIFDALGLDGSEEFHSNFLAWLLDPKGSHGMGAGFLQGFLAVSGASRAIRSTDQLSTTIQREHYLERDGSSGRLDILIRNESAGFLCAVENKVWSGESGDQLAWYRSVLEAEYPDHQVRLVFLTRWGDDPGNPGERGYWKQLSYTAILRLIERTVETANGAANEDVLAFLRQYATTLRRNLVPEVSNDVHELARRIYRKHQRAIDLINDNKSKYQPNYVTEWFRMVREAVREQQSWTDRATYRPYARFVSRNWQEYEELLSLDGGTYFLLHFGVYVTAQGASLRLLLYEGDNRDLRRKIFSRVKENVEESGVFNCEEPEYTDDLIRLHRVNILDEADYKNWWDEEVIHDVINTRLRNFARDQFPEIDRIMVECLEEYRSENG
jgi:hypothetical protein